MATKQAERRKACIAHYQSGCGRAAAAERVSLLTAHLRPGDAAGELVAERAAVAGVKDVVFDRGSYLYHGRVKALGDAARRWVEFLAKRIFVMAREREHRGRDREERDGEFSDKPVHINRIPAGLSITRPEILGAVICWRSASPAFRQLGRRLPTRWPGWGWCARAGCLWCEGTDDVCASHQGLPCTREASSSADAMRFPTRRGEQQGWTNT
jgi:hypothetical protein